MPYPVLKETVRIKKTPYSCKIIEITQDISSDITPVMAFVLSLCNGVMDSCQIAHCLSLVWRLEPETADTVLKEYMDYLSHFLYFQEEAILKQTRYQMEDFVYAEKPVTLHTRWDTPYSATLVLTNRCNFNCVYCYNDSGPTARPMLSTEQWLDIVAQLLDMGVIKFTLTGGEPLLHPGFFQILAKINEGGALAYVCTNGSLIDEAAVKRFTGIGQPVVQISLDSPCAETHHRLTGTANSFEAVTQAIGLLAAAGIRVNVKGLLIPQNYQEAAGLIAFCEGLGASVLVLDCYDLCTLGRGDASYLITDEMAAQVDGIVREAKQRTGMVVNFVSPKRRWAGSDDMVRCGSLTDSLTLLSDGEYTVCEKTAGNPCWHFGYYPDLSIAQFWESDIIEKKFRPAQTDYEEPCRSCTHLEECGSGCFANKQLINAKPYAPDPYCWKADYKNNPIKEGRV